MEVIFNKENFLEISVKVLDLQVGCSKGENYEKGNGKRFVIDEYDEFCFLMKSMKISKEDVNGYEDDVKQFERVVKSLLFLFFLTDF